jgi:hypothetical protein
MNVVLNSSEAHFILLRLSASKSCRCDESANGLFFQPTATARILALRKAGILGPKACQVNMTKVMGEW